MHIDTLTFFRKHDIIRHKISQHGGRKMTHEPERWYSLKEIMEHLGVSRETILIWISKRGMPASKVGRLWKFKKTEVDEWIKSGGAAD